MADKILMKGNEAIAEAAIAAGCHYFFGYPITPQNELPEYMSRRLSQIGGAFVQAESETSAINMVYGAASAGVRTMTSSSSPGVSLKQEGISYLVGSELPCVVVNMMRGGPGLGSIQPAQGDYFQTVKGGGHGDYRMITLAPATVQEMIDLTRDAFELADAYRNPVIILGDGMLGQMMEPVVIPEAITPPSNKPWATVGTGGTREPNIVNSLFIEADACEAHNIRLQAKFAEMEREVRYETINPEAEIMLVAYGTTARICRTAMDLATKNGLSVGLIRPISLFPFPTKAFTETVATTKCYLTVEMSAGQMVDDVRLALEGQRPVHFYGRMGGMVPTVQEILAKLTEIAEGGK